MRGRRKIHWGRGVFYALVAVLAAWLAWAGRAIWLPLGVAFVIAVVLDPTVDRLENRGCPRSLATALVFLLFLAGSALAIILLSPGISSQAGQMAQDLGRLIDPQRPDLVPVARKVLDKLNTHPDLQAAVLKAAQSGTHRLQQALHRGSEFLLAWVQNFAMMLIVPVLAFYLLNDFHRIYAKGILLVPRRHRPFAQTLVAEISAVFGKYLRGLILLCTLLGCSSAALLYFLHNPYWQLLGFTAGLLYAVPVVGSLFTLGLVFLVTLVHSTPGHALLTAGALALLTTGLFDQVITPRIVGRQVGLHPVFTIIALMLGYQVAGIGGMLVAVPLAASVQTVVVHLIPKLGIDMELRPLEELKHTEDETREEHLEAEEKPLDEHFHLHSVIENVETAASEEAPPPPARETVQTV